MNPDPTADTAKQKWQLPFTEHILETIRSFSLVEKLFFYFFVCIFVLSGIILLWQVNSHFLVEVPDYGGEITEGVVGTPRFINPILAVSDIDRDLSTLIYSGLLKADRDGVLTPDLAQSYTISEDGLTYTFVLKKDAKFQDGTKVTADDIIFTVEKAQDPALKSPRKVNWDGVTVTKLDDETVQFGLKRPYGAFIQNMTLGILPKHIWKTASDDEFPFSQFNTKPVGSGPYKIDKIIYTASGLPQEYRMAAFDAYASGEPYISHVTIKSYQDENSLISAYKNGDIESLYGISPKQLNGLNTDENSIILSPLPRVFGVFFNQNVAPALVRKEVRQALAVSVDKDAIIRNVLDGYGQPIDEPIPPGTIHGIVSGTDEQQGTTTDRILRAQAILTKAGWKQNDSGVFQKKDAKGTITLSFSISTSDAPELKAAAEMLQSQWQKLGAQVDVKIFETSDLNQNIIRPRKYDALLFGEIVGRDLDLYPFWHSSQRNDPGLNIALYTNLKADTILETLRETTDPEKQKTLYDNFNAEVSSDQPAVFIYSPYFIYVVPKKVHNITLGQLNTASERLNNISSWYIETSKVWNIFNRKK